MIHREQLRDFEWPLLLIVLALAAIGIAFIWSATFEYVPEGDSFARGKAVVQVRWLLLSLAALAVVVYFDYYFFHRHAVLFYAGGIALLLAVLVFGHTAGHATRWLRIGAYRLQPSEIMKVAIIIALARHLCFRRNVREMKGLIWPFALVLGPMALIIKQPDLGTAIVLLPVLFIMLYVAGARLKHLATAIGIGLAATPVLWFTVMSQTQKLRIISFLRPGADRLGSGFHGLQSLIAIGSGGFTGKGFAMGSQHLLDLLPAAHTDFIFAVIAEEWGFLGGMLVLGLFFAFFVFVLRVAARTREPFGRLLVAGGLSLFAFQVGVNVGMTMRLCPITGLTLPFVSYGGSSLLSSFVLLGLVLNVGMRRKTVVAPDDFA